MSAAADVGVVVPVPRVIEVHRGAAPVAGRSVTVATAKSLGGLLVAPAQPLLGRGLASSGGCHHTSILTLNPVAVSNAWAAATARASLIGLGNAPWLAATGLVGIGAVVSSRTRRRRRSSCRRLRCAGASSARLAVMRRHRARHHWPTGVVLLDHDAPCLLAALVVERLDLAGLAFRCGGNQLVVLGLRPDDGAAMANMWITASRKCLFRSGVGIPMSSAISRAIPSGIAAGWNMPSAREWLDASGFVAGVDQCGESGCAQFGELLGVGVGHDRVGSLIGRGSSSSSAFNAAQHGRCHSRTRRSGRAARRWANARAIRRCSSIGTSHDKRRPVSVAALQGERQTYRFAAKSTPRVVSWAVMRYQMGVLAGC